MSDHLVFYFSPNYWILSYLFPWPIILRDFCPLSSQQFQMITPYPAQPQLLFLPQLLDFILFIPLTNYFKRFLSFIFPTISNDHTVPSSAPACYWLSFYCEWSPCTWHESPTYDYYFEIRCFQQFSDYAFRLLYKPFQVCKILDHINL